MKRIVTNSIECCGSRAVLPSSDRATMIKRLVARVKKVVENGHAEFPADMEMSVAALSKWVRENEKDWP